jgi:hypothetical protein
MADAKEQRMYIKICFKLGKTVSETHWMFKEIFGDNALGQTQTYVRTLRAKIYFCHFYMIHFPCIDHMNSVSTPANAQR